MIWVHVSLPPSEEHPTHIKGKTPTSNLPNAELRRQKVEALQFCVSFAYAVKHYLRGEDGADYDDLARVLPPRFGRFDELGRNTNRASPTSYSATASINGESNGTVRPLSDATKRVRRKRSKKDLDGRSIGLSTPLLGSSHQTIEFHPYADKMSIPLPLLIAHELTGAIFTFKREGLLDTVGPAGKRFLLFGTC
ncbi:hypothetical protein ID866_1889 [Astraeus odoratus]|nr:hypothetical protein ID866_1889 [Astraeus odoratus]